LQSTLLGRQVLGGDSNITFIVDTVIIILL
jgi:hypothetical protein